MDLAQQAYEELFHKTPKFRFLINYSGRFKPYNAKVEWKRDLIHFKLSKTWESIDQTIQKGLLQYLLAKLFKSKKQTEAMDLYHHFIKALGKYDQGTTEDALLEAVFHELNERFFHGMIDMPHLKWGKKSTTRLGSYDFHTNTITISSIFKEGPHDLLAYVMYHELLHKQLQYRQKNNKIYYHTAQFKQREKNFAPGRDMEKELHAFLRQWKQQHQKPQKKKITKRIFSWW